MRRIAFGRIAQESNSLSPVTTDFADFERTHLLQGDELLRACQPDGFEAPGFLRDAELSGFLRAVAARSGQIEAVPTLSAWAVPGGPIARATLENFKDRLTDQLRRAGPLDGVMLSLHGAMTATDTDEPEAEILAAVREAVPGARIAVSLDLHANLTPRKLENIDVLAAYHTNPHRDHAKTGERAGAVLCDTLLGKIRPVTTWRSLPMVIGGGLTLDFLPPMLSVFWRLGSLERKVPGVLLANLFMSHLWLDTPELGWSVHVTTDGDRAQADRVADELADRLWAVRHRMPPDLPNADEAIAIARSARIRRKFGIVAMCDASDVVGAGAPGDRTELLDAALRRGKDLRWYMPIRDPDAIRTLAEQAIGSRVSMAVGASLDPDRSRPVHVEGRLLRFDLTESFGRVAILDLGHVQLVVTEGAALAMKPEFYLDRGLDPWQADVVVVKSFFPFRLYFARYIRKSIYVRTGGGTTDFDAWRQMSFARPTWPADPVQAWRPLDRARRAGWEAS